MYGLDARKVPMDTHNVVWHNVSIGNMSIMSRKVNMKGFGIVFSPGVC